MDEVMTGTNPVVESSDVVELGARFGLAVASFVDLGSERDRTLLLIDIAGHEIGVLKVSNEHESADVLDMEAAAAAHVAAVDAEIPIVAPKTADDGAARVRHADRHWVRAYPVVHGRRRPDARTLGDAAIGAWGATTARLGRALRGFHHPSASRTMPWDVQHAAQCRPMLDAIESTAARGSVAGTLDRFDAAVAPRWPLLRHQVIHGDLTTDNAVTDGAGRITAVLDFGDMGRSAVVADLVAVFDSLCVGRDRAEQRRVARLALDGFQRVVPLEPDELDLLGELWATRTAIGIAIASWRAASGLEDPEFALRYVDDAIVMLDGLLADGWDDLRRSLGDGRSTGRAMADLVSRRAAVLGPAIEPLTYADPVQVVAGEGTWLIDDVGRRLLDAYNNVPCVGHAHPRVAAAVARASRQVSTNLRYLHPTAIDLAERLVASMPVGLSRPLDTVMFVNSGSEANDLAWRLACLVSGGDGGLCTEHAYHGITTVLAPLSPETVDDHRLPTWVERWRPPDAVRGLDLAPGAFDAAVDRLRERGHRPAMTILDGVLQSDGVLLLEPAYVHHVVRRTHDAGALFVADEVQGGHGRTGGSMWSFERFGLVGDAQPDIVTMGKPMGNGYPIGAVVTTRDVAERFAGETVFFSTFGGNTVAVAAASSVLDVLDDERVLSRVTRAGAVLRAVLGDAVGDHARIGEIRGVGLANAVELVTDRDTLTPDPVLAAALKERLRYHGVLVGTTGRHGNVLKVRPPLAFTEHHAPLVADALCRSLDDLLDG
jgi:4-aminobutyrate aminotransferase-like enzyme/Ser/Thr protein kinase RdoA (MazF antagonist)